MKMKICHTSPAASINKLESTRHTSENSEDFLEEDSEQRVTDFEDESSDKDTWPTPESQSYPQKDDGEGCELEPVNGEIIDDSLKTSFVAEGEDSSSEELKV